MNTIIKSIPYLIAIIPQMLFKQYEWVVIVTIVIGFFSAFLIEKRNVFLKIALLELVVFLVVFYIYKEHVFYLGNVFKNLGMPKIVVTIVFVLFNVLNIAILFFFGYKLSNLLFKKTNK